MCDMVFGDIFFFVMRCPYSCSGGSEQHAPCVVYGVEYAFVKRMHVRHRYEAR